VKDIEPLLFTSTFKGRIAWVVECWRKRVECNL